MPTYICALIKNTQSTFLFIIIIIIIWKIKWKLVTCQYESNLLVNLWVYALFDSKSSIV